MKSQLEEQKKKEKSSGLSTKSEQLTKNKIRELKQALKKLKPYEDVRERILKYGAFMAAVAKAENSDQVQAAIESVALPSGSWSIKQNSPFNISLNAYVGFNYGQFENNEKEEKIWRARMWSPVGVGLNFGIKKFPIIGSFSLFASIIDIGAVTAFRFKDESAEELSKFTIKNIYSPGIHGIFGIKNWPISIGAGYQRGPQLIESPIEGGGFELETETKWRMRFFIAVDIPILNFLTK